MQIGRSVISFTIKKVEVKVEMPATGPEKGPQAVLKPKFIQDEENENDEMEIELKKKIEITNQKIQALMMS